MWMFHIRKSHNRINCIYDYERIVRIVYNNYESSFHELRFKDNIFKIHHLHLQKLEVESLRLNWSQRLN